eukprot:CAMPEP_0206014664 /NCGR_PEP_ID=MMETSP1464-20131121/18692_1 /ASSEMBLY_ACC=CAM_ASM_001124 /TAXON_ID=119497 /ORGANISM="Exanthemachrysis gayraliae, Strain RCC1523" /LENGTH=121 /DNA_ID=CAMNT_0053388427 /DNA_START=76 /DNA_END=436 /DNA_ORIENTATION=+
MAGAHDPKAAVRASSAHHPPVRADDLAGDLRVLRSAASFSRRSFLRHEENFWALAVSTSPGSSMAPPYTSEWQASLWHCHTQFCRSPSSHSEHGPSSHWRCVCLDVLSSRRFLQSVEAMAA